MENRGTWLTISCTVSILVLNIAVSMAHAWPIDVSVVLTWTTATAAKTFRYSLDRQLKNVGDEMYRLWTPEQTSKNSASPLR